MDKYVAHSLVSLAEFQLRTLGFDVAEFGDPVFRNQVGIEGSVGIVIGAPCDGIVLFALFTFFIVAFPGAWKHKLWFIPAGIAALHIINSLRVATLAWLFWYKPEWLDFNHDYTFTILVYAFVFCLWYVWVRKFSLPRKKIRE
ncbi:MAG: archaeosortase/exosortase family protein [Flavobacteriales bacterium]|nr:archaeosortase/exosortase family protein [Flavobacteriales bacterium]